MARPKEIESEIGWLNNLKLLVETYEEIAALRMRKIRSSVLENRKFNTGLIHIFKQLKSSYGDQIEEFAKKKKNNDTAKLSLVERNGKTVAVFSSANTGLYGDLMRKIYDLMNEYIKEDTCDIVIIGRLGRRMFEIGHPDIKFTYFEFSDVILIQEELQKIIDFLVQYEKIMVFYGEFDNLISQSAVMLDLYGQSELSKEQINTPKMQYFFEPSLEKIMVFFETQIYASFFQQIMHESQLAKFAARLFSLDISSENIKKQLKQARLREALSKHQAISKKQESTLASISLWLKKR